MASAAVVVVGWLVLAGWFLDNESLKSVAPGLVAMNPMTATAFVLAGLSLWIRSERPPKPSLHTLGTLSATAVVVIALIKSVSFLGWDVGIDQLLFRDKLDLYAQPNRMAPNTTLTFLLIGLALILLDVEARRGYRPAQLLALLAAISSLFALIGYAYGVQYLYGIASYIPIALNTALAFEVLAVGILCSRPNSGLMAIVTSHSTGGILLRRLLPVALAVPAVLGWMALAGEAAGLYGTPFGLAFVVLVTIVVFAALIGWTASSLDRLDARRKRAEAERERQHRAAEYARSELRAVFDAVSEGILFVSPHQRIVTINRRFSELFGLDPDGVVGRRFDELQHQLERRFTNPAAVSARVADTAADAQQRFTENVTQRWPAPRELELSSAPVLAIDGNYLGRNYAFRDVTAQREVERLREERRRQLEEELARAAQVQAELLPREVPALPGFELAARCLPAREVGGDFFDWHEPAPGVLTFTLGDVMGKGMPAALLMATVRAALESVARRTPPATAIQTVSTALERDLESSGSFITLFHAQANIATRAVEYVDAGHGHVFVQRADGQVETLHPRGLPLGVLAEATYQEGSVVLCPGDALVVYSDGLVDARPDLSPTPAAFAQVLGGADSAREIVERLVALAAQSERPDDLTVLVLRCRSED